MSSPILINAMTGGGSEGTFHINQQLAIVAKEKGLAMAVGSQMAALKEPEQKYTYTIVRQENPNGIIFANLGAEATVDQPNKPVTCWKQMLCKFMLMLFRNWSCQKGIGNLRACSIILNDSYNASCPVIVKEVGFGLSLSRYNSFIPWVFMWWILVDLAEPILLPLKINGENTLILFLINGESKPLLA